MDLSRTRGLLYGFLSLFFFPDFDEKRYLLAQSVLENFPETGLEDFDHSVKALKEALQKKKAVEIEAEFENLFVIPFDNQPIPLEASFYLDGKIYGPSLAKLRELLRNEGLSKREEISEPEDHLGLLLAFMEVVCRENNLISQQKLFYKFLRPCAEGVIEKIMERTPDFYQKVAVFLKNFLELEKRFYEES